MICITQLIYLVPGMEKEFEAFEAVAIPLVSKYNGRMLFRIRPDENSFLQFHGEKPYEIHLAEFETEEDFRNFTLDEERKKILKLKERSVRAAVSIVGKKL